MKCLMTFQALGNPEKQVQVQAIGLVNAPIQNCRIHKDLFGERTFDNKNRLVLFVRFV